MHYTLHQLQIFLKVAEKQSITLAAKELHLSQPAVSIQLKKLQEQFDIPLVEVIGRQLYVTDFGREIEAASQKIIEEIDAIRLKTLAFKGMLAGTLKISVVSTGKYVMPYFVGDFLKKHPGVDLKMDVTNKARVIEALAKNEVDFALVSVLPEDLKISRVELMQNKLYLIRQFVDETRTTPLRRKALEKVSFIFREKGSATRQAMERFIEDLEIPMRKSMELTSNEAVKQAVMAGLGYSVMPLIGIKNEILNQELEIVPMKGLPLTTHWNLIWRKEKLLSPAAKAYQAYLEANKEEQIHTHFQWYERYLDSE